MAEKEAGLVATILSVSEEEEHEAQESSTRADDIATAVMMDTARFDPVLSKEATLYLRKQSALVDLQLHYFDEERRLATEAANRKRFFDHMRMRSQVFLSLVTAVVVAIAVVMVVDAIRSKNVVIDSFDTPRSLLDQGITGKTVAAGILDVLSNIQRATRGSAEKRKLSNSWTDEIKVAVPDTGLSVGQIQHLLKTRFGHDQIFGGDLLLNGKGELTLTVRGTNIQAKSFTDPTKNLDKLLTQAGEYVYSQSQPGLWVNYLSTAGRFDDAINFAKNVYPTLAQGEKFYVLNGWGIAIINKGGKGSPQEAMPLFQEVIRLDRTAWQAYANLMLVLASSGREEDGVRVEKDMATRAGGRPGAAAETYYTIYDSVVWDLPALIASAEADMAAHEGVGSRSGTDSIASLGLASTKAYAHDVQGAAILLKTTPLNKTVLTDVATYAATAAWIAEENGDLNEASRQWDAFSLAYVDPAVFANAPQSVCFSATTYEKTGQHAKADAALEAPLKESGYSTFVDCYRFRGDVLDLRGDWKGAKGWYEKAIKLVPSSPAGYYSYGLALARHADPAGAVAQFTLANQKGPHWADPLRAWGDVLRMQGKTTLALEKYDAALKYAPKWEHLIEARRSAAVKKS